MRILCSKSLHCFKFAAFFGIPVFIINFAWKWFYAAESGSHFTQLVTLVKCCNILKLFTYYLAKCVVKILYIFYCRYHLLNDDCWTAYESNGVSCIESVG
jgi:hypothetical protein